MTQAAEVQGEVVSTALVKASETSLAMLVTPQESLRRLRELQAFVSEVMVEGEDYGKIPGIDKPTLLQPGGQKLCEVYGFYPRWQWVEVIKEWHAPFFYFEAKCQLFSRRDDRQVGEGIGSCNSKETKYSGRWVPEKDIPGHLDRSTLEKRTGYFWGFDRDIPPGVDPGDLQHRDSVGKKSKRPYRQYRVPGHTYLLPNPDLFGAVNTMQKMAAKRAFLHAVIGATRSAGIFTHDVEDMAPEAIKPDEERGDDARGETESAGRQQPEKPKGKVAVELAHPERRKEYVQRLSAYLEGARDIDDLKAVWAQVLAAGRDGFIDRDQRAELDGLKDARKKALETAAAVPNTTTDGNDAWGVGAEEPPKGAGDAWEPGASK